MARGGRRGGAPGKSYNNRTDLNTDKGPMAPSAATGQTYGAAGAQVAAQRAVPIAPPPAPSTAAPAGPVGSGAATASGPTSPPLTPPGAVVPLDAPSMRPNEPVTAGLPVGPGAGVEANPFSSVGSTDDAVLGLRVAYSIYPSEELRAILEAIDLDG